MRVCGISPQAAWPTGGQERMTDSERRDRVVEISPRSSTGSSSSASEARVGSSTAKQQHFS